MKRETNIKAKCLFLMKKYPFTLLPMMARLVVKPLMSKYSIKNAMIKYSKIPTARTLMARIPCLTRIHSWVPRVPYMRLLWSIFCIYFYMLLLSFSIFSDRRSLKIENENNSTKILTAEVSYMGLGSLEFRFIHRRRKRGGQAPPPPNNLRGGGNIPFGPPIIHPSFPSISMRNRKKSQMYQVEG